MHATDGASLIARAHALDHFVDMQATAAAAASKTASAPAPASAPTSCLCFGGSSSSSTRSAPRPPPKEFRGNLGGVGAARRAQVARGGGGVYRPDNLAVKPERECWGEAMERLIVACCAVLEEHGLDEPNLFAVSAVDDLVRGLRLAGDGFGPETDPHVAAGVIKARVRYAESPLVGREGLRRFIGREGPGTGWEGSVLKETVGIVRKENGVRRAYVFARVMRLLGRVSANVERSRMNAHCLAKCVAPSMLHWDPNSTFALLMLGKITAYVMAMIEEARVYDEEVCATVEALKSGRDEETD